MPTHMSISVADQNAIFTIITQNPQIINWLSVGRLKPSADAICDAAHYMEYYKGASKDMRDALLKAFPNAKQIRYHRQFKYLAIMFDTYKGSSLLNTLTMLNNNYISNNGNITPLSYRNLV